MMLALTRGACSSVKMTVVIAMLLLVMSTVTFEAALATRENVIWAHSLSASGSYGATSYRNDCNNPPATVTGRFPGCTSGRPLASLRIGTEVSGFFERLEPGSAVFGPTGLRIAESDEKFYAGELERSLSDAGIACTNFYSFVDPSGVTPIEMNDGCAMGLGNFLGSTSAARFAYRGSCTATTGTWYAEELLPCSTPGALLCVCTSLNTPTVSPTLPTPAPSRAPSLTPTVRPSNAPAEPTSAPTTLSPTTKQPTTRAPTREPTTRNPTTRAPTSSPSMLPTYDANTIVMNVVWTLKNNEDMDYGYDKILEKCADINEEAPSSVTTYFPTCRSGEPLASVGTGRGIYRHLNTRLVGKVVGPYGLVIADNETQFFAEPFLSLRDADVDCGTSNVFFSGSLADGAANTANAESECGSSGQYLENKSSSRSYSAGSCASTNTNWLASTTRLCNVKAALLCFCRVSHPTPAPSRSPTAPTFPEPSRSPTVPAPTKLPTPKPTENPTRASPYGPTAENVIYIGATNADSEYGKDGGLSRYRASCEEIPDAVYEKFPRCVRGAPLAGMQYNRATKQFKDTVREGKIYGPNGLLIAESAEQFYRGGLANSLQAAGVTCTTFWSGATSGLATPRQCQKESGDDSLTDDDEDSNWNLGSCTATNPTWFSTSSPNCKSSTKTALLCYCQVEATAAPFSPPANTTSSASGSASQAVTTAAWSLVGALSALIVLGGVFFLWGKPGTAASTTRPVSIQSTAIIANTEANDNA